MIVCNFDDAELFSAEPLVPYFQIPSYLRVILAHGVIRLQHYMPGQFIIHSLKYSFTVISINLHLEIFVFFYKICLFFISYEWIYNTYQIILSKRVEKCQLIRMFLCPSVRQCCKLTYSQITMTICFIGIYCGIFIIKVQYIDYGSFTWTFTNILLLYEQW